MKLYTDCIPCIISQTVKLSADLGLKPDDQKKLLREVLLLSSEVSYDRSPPHIAKEVYRLIHKILKNPDPYRKVKEKYNQLALKFYPSLKEEVKNSRDRFKKAVKLSIAGNVIDFGSNRKFSLEKTIKDALRKRLSVDHTGSLKRSLIEASKVLYLGDNAGETVFDRILIEEFPEKQIYYGVRGSPVINDATLKDALACGLDSVAHLISNGSDAPGTILEDCSFEFKSVFDQSDLVIAKGQGNYETLNEVGGKKIFFLFMVKCPVIAADAGCPVGGYVVMENKSG
ncbi:MAG: hypothetical protein AMJ90_07730 [candidate division Zixibacteria bacterium SM23_73_2]|nr:MAG: hypothetical protein AMJ90_07730 [candidate division Zixibacteria bacterium SM23_73_2]